MYILSSIRRATTTLAWLVATLSVAFSITGCGNKPEVVPAVPAQPNVDSPSDVPKPLQDSVATFDQSGGHRFAQFEEFGVVRVVTMVNDAGSNKYGVYILKMRNHFREGVWLRHDDKVYHVAFSLGGTKVVSASKDKSAVVWSISGSKYASYKHDDTVCYVEFSPDGSKVVSASYDKSAAVWDAKTGNSIASYKHGDRVPRAAFSPDGSKVVSASWDKTAVVWDAKTGDKIASYNHGGTVYHAVFSPDGSKVVSSSIDKTAAVWDAKSGKTITSIHTNSIVWRAAFSPDGSMVVVENEEIVVRDAMTGSAPRIPTVK